MFFPTSLKSLNECISSLKNKDRSNKIQTVNIMIRTMEGFSNRLDIGILNLMYEYRSILENGSAQAVSSLERQIMAEADPSATCQPNVFSHCAFQSDFFSRIVPDIPEYENLYIFYICNAHNRHHTINREILSNINYINRMTRDVTFIMPGYRRASSEGSIINADDPNMPLEFDENLFINYVQYIEDKSDSEYLYTNECELLFIPAKDINRYDFDNMVRVDLYKLETEKGISPVDFFLSLSQHLRKSSTRDIPVQKIIGDIVSKLSSPRQRRVKKIFIAGSKRLVQERNVIREELSRLQNRLHITVYAYSYEDFETSLTGYGGGRQNDYNEFIAREADAVIFIFDKEARRATEDEFFLSYNTFRTEGRPEIFVYAKKLDNIFDHPSSVTTADERLEKIIRVFRNDKPEYFVEYENTDQLQYLICRDMNTFLNR